MNVDEQWAIEVFQALKALNKNDLFFQCNLRADSIGEPLAKAMADARCWLCHLGIESRSDRVLGGIGKNITVAQIEQALSTLKKFGIKTYGFFMCYQVWEKNGQLVTESTKEVFKTLLYILNLRVRGLLDYGSWAIATPYPGSELYDICVNHRLIGRPKRSRSIYLPWDITLNLPGVHRITIVIMRFFGILIQGLLLIFDGNGYKIRALRMNLKHLMYKLKLLP